MGEFDVQKLAEELKRNYEENTHLNEQKSALLPNSRAIEEIVDDLRDLFYPGFFSTYNSAASYGLYQISDQILLIRGRLIREASLAICHQYAQDNPDAPMNCHELQPNHPEAIRIVDRFLERLPAVRNHLATDVKAAFDGDPAATGYADVIIAYPGVFAIMVHRLAHELYVLGLPMIPRIMSEYAHQRTGIDIHPGATIGDYFFIDHGTGVVIGETTVIGHHVKIYQGVTLGALSTRGGQCLRGHKRHPKIGDYVTIYGGATILGGETEIGSNVTIGGNVFITKSVTPETKVSIRGHNLKYVNSRKKSETAGD